MKNIDLEKEQKLLARAQQDKTKFADLYQYYLNDVYRFSYSICGNQHDAEDITSQTFVEMFNYLEKFEWREISLKYWLFRTSKNIAYRNFEKSSKSQTTDNFDIIPEAKDESFEKVVLDKDELNLVVAEIEGLKPIERELINLRVWEEMSFEEIAGILDEKPITVRQRFYRSVEKVRVSLSSKNYKRYASIAGVLGCFSAAGESSAFVASPAIAASIAQSLAILLPQTIMTTGILTGAIASAKAFVATNILTTSIIATTTVAAVAGGGYVAYNKINEKNVDQISQNNSSKTFAEQTPTLSPSNYNLRTETFILHDTEGYSIDAQQIVLNGIRDNEKLSGNGKEFILESSDFKLSFSSAMIDYGYEYSELKDIGNGLISNVIARVKIKNSTSNYPWNYVTKFDLEKDCILHTGDTNIKPPCGGSVFKDSENTNKKFFFFLQLNANNEEGLKRADEIIKNLTANYVTNTRSETLILNPDPTLFPGTKIILNGLKDDEKLTSSNILKSADFTLTFNFRYEDFDRQYKSVTDIGTGTSSPTNFRILKLGDNSNSWYYITNYQKTGTCFVDGSFTGPAPCGPEVYLNKNDAFVEINVKALNTNGLKRADEIIKMMEAVKI